MFQCSQSESERPITVNKSACEDKGCKCAEGISKELYLDLRILRTKASDQSLGIHVHLVFVNPSFLNY